MSKSLARLVVLLMILTSPVSGQIVEDTNITVNSSIGSFGLTVFQTPESGENGDITGVSGSVTLAGQIATLLFDNTGLDEGSDWFATNLGDPFTGDAIESGQFDPLVVLQGSDGVFFGSLDVEVNQSFFLGVNTGVDPIDFQPSRQHFGWGEFLVTQNGELQILDSAVAYDRTGIVIGQSVAIPEPSLGLLMLAVAAFPILRRSRRGTIQTPYRPAA